jgi:hypothetical protein
MPQIHQPIRLQRRADVDTVKSQPIKTARIVPTVRNIIAPKIARPATSNSNLRAPKLPIPQKPNKRVLLANKENTLRSKVVKSHNTFPDIMRKKTPIPQKEPVTKPVESIINNHSELYMNKRAEMKRKKNYPTLILEDLYTPRSMLVEERENLKSLELKKLQI